MKGRVCKCPGCGRVFGVGREHHYAICPMCFTSFTPEQEEPEIAPVRSEDNGEQRMRQRRAKQRQQENE